MSKSLLAKLGFLTREDKEILERKMDSLDVNLLKLSEVIGNILANLKNRDEQDKIYFDTLCQSIKQIDVKHSSDLQHVQDTLSGYDERIRKSIGYQERLGDRITTIKQNVDHQFSVTNDEIKTNAAILRLIQTQLARMITNYENHRNQLETEISDICERQRDTKQLMQFMSSSEQKRLNDLVDEMQKMDQKSYVYQKTLQKDFHTIQEAIQHISITLKAVVNKDDIENTNGYIKLILANQFMDQAENLIMDTNEK